MYDRKRAIANAFESTCEWIFEDNDFKGWLEATKPPLIWIQGMPGSGKSTLMKFISSSLVQSNAMVAAETVQRVSSAGNRAALKRLAVGSNGLVVDFYFGVSGLSPETSFLDFLRSLLHQLLSAAPELIPYVFPRRWNTLSLSQSLQLPPWDEEELVHGLKSVLRALTRFRELFFLIDGLDEYHGDQELLPSILQSMSAQDRVKVCVSSRETPIFEAAFKHESCLALQDSNYHDIWNWTSNLLLNHRLTMSYEERLFSADHIQTVDMLVSKASGVFLWAKLAIEALDFGSRPNDLERQLNEIPSGLGDLYKKILRIQHSRDRGRFSQMLRFLSQAGGSISALHLSYARESVASAVRRTVQPMSEAEIEARHDEINLMRAEPGMSLLQITPASTSGLSSTESSQTIQFAHISFRDFLLEETGFFEAICDPQVDTNLQLLAGGVVVLKTTRMITYQDLRNSESEFWHLIASCMRYALLVSPTNSADMIRLLDELDRTASSLVSSLTRGDPELGSCENRTRYLILQGLWAAFAPGVGLHPLIGETFLALVIRFGVVAYVESKCTCLGLGQRVKPYMCWEEETFTSKSMTSVYPVLIDALFIPQLSAWQSAVSECYYGRLAGPSLEMIKCLLDKGASFSSPWLGSASSGDNLVITPWDILLHYIVRGFFEDTCLEIVGMAISCGQSVPAKPRPPSHLLQGCSIDQLRAIARLLKEAQSLRRPGMTFLEATQKARLHMRHQRTSYFWATRRT